MPIDWLVLSSAALTGLLGGLHCALMCGGIATTLGATSARPSFANALLVNAARVLGYVLAGAAAGGLGGGIVQVARSPMFAIGVRAATGLVLILIALRMLGVTDGQVSGPAQAAWRVLAPLQQRLLPANTAAKRLALGMLWGWLPCGLSTTVLMAAWLQASALRGALVMAAFGLATLPLMVPLTWSGARALMGLQRGGLRHALAAVVLVAGLITLLAPWLARHPMAHTALKALGCAVP